MRFDLAGARDRLAFLNLSAYKVPGDLRAEDRKVIAALPSTRACVSWAQSVLFPQARQGKRLVLCMRPAEKWGLVRRDDEPYGKALYVPTFRRNYMPGGAFKDRLVAAIAKALAEPMR